MLTRLVAAAFTCGAALGLPLTIPSVSLGHAVSSPAASSPAVSSSAVTSTSALPVEPAFADDNKSKYKVDFVSLGMSVIDRAGLKDTPLEEITPEVLLERSFLTMRLGIFDLCLSKHSSEDKRKADQFINLGDALLRTQGQFLEWIGKSAPGYDQAKKDIKTLQAWLKGMRKDVIAGLDDEVRGEISSVLTTKDKVLEAQARFGTYMASGEPLGLAREGELVEPVLLAPDRREFIELLSTFGLLFPDQQYIYHDNDVLDWTNAYCNDLTVVALEFAELGSSTSGAFGGVSMDSRANTGTAQQISQLAAGAMLDNLYGSKIPPSLAGALAVNLVIDVFGECNTRVDGDLKSRRTEAREMFVPGGMSEGGILPPLMADSRWRSEHGSDRYLTGLQGSQSAGDSKAKKRSEKSEFFEIKNDMENDSMYLRAPFLGKLASDRNLIIPDTYFGDAQEMFRAYRTAFAYWLQREFLGKKKGEKAFSEFLSKLAQAEPTDSALEDMIQQIYAKPLTAEDPDGKKDLEGEFLVWLSKN
ncbi:MAG: hypothetical protein ACI8WY_000790 [Planctomycetota bacterium]|jgi:hypothetical protein